MDQPSPLQPADFDPSTAQPAEIPPMLRAPQSDFDPSSAVPLEQAAQVAAKTKLNNFYAGNLDMSKDQFDQAYHLAQGRSYALERLASGAGVTLQGVGDTIGSAFSPESWGHAASWLGEKGKDILKPYFDAADLVQKGKYEDAGKALVMGDLENAKNLAIGVVGGTAGMVSSGIGAIQGGTNVMQELTGLTAVKRALGIDGTTEAYALGLAQNRINKTTEQLYKTSETDPEKATTQIGDLLPWLLIPADTVMGGAKLAGRVGEATPGAIQKAAEVGLKAGAPVMRQGVPVVAGGVAAAAGHPIIGAEIAAGAIPEAPLKMGGLLFSPARLVNHFTNWTADNMSKLADLLGTAGQPGQTLSESIANSVRDSAAKAQRQAADMYATAKPEVQKYLKTDADGTFLYSVEDMPKDAQAIFEKRQLADQMNQKADFWNSMINANKVLSSAARGAGATAAALGEAGVIGGGLAASESAPGDTEAIRKGAQTVSTMALPFAPLVARQGLRSLRGERGRDALGAIGENVMTPDHEDYNTWAAGMVQLPLHAKEQVNVMNGFGAPLGVKVIPVPDAQMADVVNRHHPDTFIGEKSPTPNGFVSPVNGDLYVKASKIQSGTWGHEFSHAYSDAVGRAAAEGMPEIEKAMQDPKTSPAYKQFAQTYLDAVRRSVPDFDPLSPEKTSDEAYAELGRRVLTTVPPEFFYGGETGADVLKRGLGKIAAKVAPEWWNALHTDKALNAPYSHAQEAAIRQGFFNVGEAAQRGETVGTKPEPGASGNMFMPPDEEINSKVQSMVDKGVPEDEAVRGVAQDIQSGKPIRQVPDRFYVQPRMGQHDAIVDRLTGEIVDTWEGPDPGEYSSSTGYRSAQEQADAENADRPPLPPDWAGPHPDAFIPEIIRKKPDGNWGIEGPKGAIEGDFATSEEAQRALDEAHRQIYEPSQPARIEDQQSSKEGLMITEDPTNPGRYQVIDPKNGRLVNYSLPKDVAEDIVKRSKTEDRFMPDLDENLDNVIKDYVGKAGFQYTPHKDYRPLNEGYYKDLADAYAASGHNPDDPAVQKSYNAFKQAIIEQYKTLVDHGYTIEPWPNEGQPYANSAEMLKDLRGNKHLYYFETARGYGHEGDASMELRHPMLEGSGIHFGDKEAMVNDIFRAVHDALGHGAMGFQFGPRGEYNAFLKHASTLPHEAWGALANETIGPNSWTNFGPHMRDAQGNILKKGDPGYLSLPERPFVAQRANVLKFQPDLGATGPNAITANEVKGTNSRPVTQDEFYRLRAQGKQQLADMRADTRRSMDGLDNPERWNDTLNQTFAKVQHEWGGATINPETGGDINLTGKEGGGPYAMSAKDPGQKTIEIPIDSPQSVFNAAMNKAKRTFTQLNARDHYLGVFRDDQKGTIDIDPVVILDTKDQVEAIGAHTRAIGGAYDYSTGNGVYPPHIATEQGGRIGSPGMFDRSSVDPSMLEMHDEAVQATGAEPKKRFYEQKPAVQQKITDFMKQRGAQFMPEGEDFYHVTTKENADRILKEGLIPQIGPRSKELGEPTPKSYFFKNKQEMEDGVTNWLGDQFNEDTPLVALRIRPSQDTVIAQEPGSFDYSTSHRISPSQIQLDDTRFMPDITNENIAKHNVDQVLTNKRILPKLAQTLRDNLPKEFTSADNVEQVHKAIQFFKENLLDSYDLAAKEPWAEGASKQYEGYHIYAHKLASEFNLPPENVMVAESALSPSTSPDNSFEMTRRLATMLRDNQDHPFDKKMAEAAKNFSSPLDRADIKYLMGKKFSDLPKNDSIQAKWMRAYDEAYNPDRLHRVVTPSGELGDYVKTKTGKNQSMNWSSYDIITKGIGALQGELKPSDILKTPKVSNYFTSKLRAFEHDPSVTVDTHHTSAAFGTSIPSNHPLVTKNFTSKRGSTGEFGGLYSLIQEATIEAAKERDVNPKAFQAQVWTYQRGLKGPASFGQLGKAGREMVQKIQQIWKDANAGKLTRQEAYAKTEEIARDYHGVVPTPDWAR